MNKPGTAQAKPMRVNGQWTPFQAENRVWYWFYKPQLPNGWTPSICDDSQSHEPPLPTRYQVFAAAGTIGHVAGASFESFEDAKREALKLAMDQPDAAKVRARKKPSTTGGPEEK
jgi:hypothetical protein